VEKALRLLRPDENQNGDVIAKIVQKVNVSAGLVARPLYEKPPLFFKAEAEGENTYPPISSPRHNTTR